VLTLPEDLDPCDFLLREGAGAFRSLVDSAVDPLTFALDRAEQRFEVESPEGSRQAAEWVLSVLARVPSVTRAGLDVKVAKALDSLSRRLRVPVSTLDRRLRQIQREARRVRPARPASSTAATAIEEGEGHLARPDAYKIKDSAIGPAAEPAGSAAGAKVGAPVPIRPASLDPLDRELIEVVLNEPASVGRVISRVAVGSLRDAPLRAILQACYDLYGEGQSPSFELVSLRLDDRAVRALAVDLSFPIEPAPLPEGVRPAPWQDRLEQVLVRLTERERQVNIQAVRDAMKEVDHATDPEQYHALHVELVRLMSQRPVTK
jgi:DNA primase